MIEICTTDRVVHPLDNSCSLLKDYAMLNNHRHLIMIVVQLHFHLYLLALSTVSKEELTRLL
jgi:hypothetical protein